jgi:hypothetical protein
MEDCPSTLLLMIRLEENPISRKKKKESLVEIHKGTQATITRALREGKSLPMRER